ncbi:MAG: hypothetical protein K2Q20_00115, partial [Phycisphaerales bacterium]|nr:hypothetical protein [Phycisphaerales bacterium]
AFKNVTVDQIIPFIADVTGKVVIPQPSTQAIRITLLSDQPVARERALDLVILALQQNGVAVVETQDLILLRDLGEIDRQDVPVIGPDETLIGRTDQGSIVEKVFALRHASAPNVQELLKTTLPPFAKMTMDPESNQLIVMGNIGLLQRIERLVVSLDQPAAASLATETFRLRYADSTQVATNIRDLFAQAAGNNQNQNQNPFQNFFRGGQQGGGGQNNQGGNRGGQQGGNGNRQNSGQSGAQTSSNLRVTSNAQQNAVTVLAEKSILDQIREQISQNWDRPLPEQAVVPRVYDLKNTDPVKIKATLTTLFGNAGSAEANQQQNQSRGANPLYGQFSFDAIPDSGRLVVVAKNPENIDAISKIIADLDQPQASGLPQIIELKHAQAEELAEQLNALLAQEGTLAQITRQETGLTTSASSRSPFASDSQTTTNTNQNNQNQQNAAGSIRFWWQNARPPTTNAGSSNLVSKLRIVPVWRQNALMVLSPPEYQASVLALIESLDRPGRQVLLSAVIAEISVDDSTALGLRWGSSPITPTNNDNSISIGGQTQANGTTAQTVTGTKNNLLPSLFDTSVLNIGVNINAVLQALAQKTAVNILSEPRIFTSDNQQAEFFSGQDVPFITDSQTSTANNNLIQSFDYRAVGIALRVRPRITVKRDVDLQINLELSNIEPSQTLFGGFIVDRRETTTHLIVRDGQTVVVSGILRTEESDTVRKVPLLGDIPLVGELFKSTEKTKNKTELIAFITPYVITNPEDAGATNAKDLKRLDELKTELRPTEELDKRIKPFDKPASPPDDAPTRPNGTASDPG